MRATKWLPGTPCPICASDAMRSELEQCPLCGAPGLIPEINDEATQWIKQFEEANNV